MKLIANSVFQLPDGTKTVPGAEIPSHPDKTSEWVSKGFAYFVDGEPSVKVSDNSEPETGNGEGSEESDEKAPPSAGETKNTSVSTGKQSTPANKKTPPKKPAPKKQVKK